MARILSGSGHASLPPLVEWPAPVRTLLLLGFAGAAGIVGGFISASGKPALVAVFIGLLLAVLVVSSRIAVFWFVVAAALVVAGLAQLYLPGARFVRYLVPVASLGLLLHWVVDYMTTVRRTPEPIPGPVLWAFGFAAIGVVAVMANLSSPGVAMLGARNYFQMWALFLGVAFLRWPSNFARQVYLGLVLIALVQLPFAAHQYLFLVPKRIPLVGDGLVPVDVVAGTFGAQLYGGGANAVLGAFQVIVVGLLLAQWKNGALSMLRAFVLSALLLSPLLVNQVKVVVLYLPLMFGVLFWRELLLRPLKFLVAAVAIAGLSVTMVAAILATHPTGRLHSFPDLVEFVVTRQTASIEERQGQYAALSRWTALTFWAREHVKASPSHTLLGHGLGASREPEMGSLDRAPTLAQQRYAGLRIGYTAVSALLWDTGLVGLAAVMGMFASAFFMAGRLARHYRGRDPFRTGLFEGLQAAMAVLALSLAHKDFFVVHIPFQALVYLLVGFIAHSWLQVVRGEGPVHARPAV